jgi:lipoprotein-releasing system permease protein
MLGVLIGSAAFIIILSGFNGLKVIILSQNNNFSPELKIEPRLGKTFDPNTAYFNTLRYDPQIFSITMVLQEKVIVKYGDKPFIATMRGVSDDFLKNPLLDSIIQSGSFTLKSDGQYFTVIGSRVQGSLGINIHDKISPIDVYSSSSNAASGSNPINLFTVRAIMPSGVFSAGSDFDDIIMVPIKFVRELLNEPKTVSFLEINYKESTDLQTVQDAIKDKIGNKFTVKNRDEQNTELYKTLNFERWSIFMILTFVLIIAIFNIIGSLTMLVIDKQKDIAILTSLGANKQMIQRIFFFEGMMISIIGCIIGLILGLIFCILQQRFGFVKMGSKMSVLDAYPVSLRSEDFVLVFLTVTAIAIIASGINTRLSIKGLNDIKQDL